MLRRRINNKAQSSARRRRGMGVDGLGVWGLRGVSLETQKCPRILSLNNGHIAGHWRQEVELGRSPETG